MPLARSSRPPKACSQTLTFLRCTGAVLALTFAFLGNAAPALAAPLFRLDLHHYPTNFTPGASGDYQVEIANIGDTATTGPLSLRLALPNGLGRDSIQQSGPPTWSCPGAPGDRVTVCTSSGQIPRHSVVRNLILSADVAPTASGERFASARLEGGGAAERATTNELTSLSAEPAPFGILPNSFLVDSFAADGVTPVREAGAHPDQMIVALDLNSTATPPVGTTQIAAAGSIRHFQLALPPGFLGNPTAPGECTPAELTVGACPRSAQVGRIEIATGPFAPAGLPKTYSQPVFNMQSPHGVLADLAFAIAGNPVHVKFSLDPANNYAILASAADVNETESLLDLRMTLWGVPADHSHDAERCGLPDTSTECATDLEAKPFLTVPADCAADQAITLRGVDSWQQPGLFAPEIPFLLPGRASECDRPRFEPSLEVAATTSQADSPTGLDLHLTVPQNENPNAPATPPLRELRLTLPPGVRISPAAADGLASCAPTEIDLGTNAPVTCPDASRIGEATLTTPLLPEPLHGFLYLAAPRANPTNSLFAVYLVVQDTEDRGILLKLSGRLDLDPESGRITALFENLPQLPFEELELGFRSGSRAPLLSAPACGTQTITASASSWARPEAPVALEDTYDVEKGPGGAQCRAPSQRPFSPAFSAGTVNPIAAATTPFVLRLSRNDDEQPLGTLSATLPLGLGAQVAGIATCPETAIATIASGEGTARGQLTEPSCPAASRLGSATVAAGAGPEPLYLSGSVYLAGPYQGGPFSLVAIVPALAGPFDLGTLSDRIAVAVDPETAQLRLSSGELPRILSGVPLELREIRLRLDRPGLIRNPTSCEEQALNARATSSMGQTAALSERFQVGSCSELGFKPALAVRFSNPARNAHPRIEVALRQRVGDANLAAVALTLPTGELLDLRRVRALCPRELAPEQCPPASRLGWAVLASPLLPDPLEGPIYLRRPSARLPDIVAEVRGEGLKFVLHGHTAAPAGRLRVRLAALPDIALSEVRFSFVGGRHGIFANSTSLCRSTPPAQAALAAHNGRHRRFGVVPRLARACRPF